MSHQLSKVIGIVALAFAVATVQSASAASFIDDEFSTYADGDLVGQNGWYTALTAQSLPVQVSGGQVVIPAGQTADNQDAFRDLPSIINAPVDIYEGLRLTMTSAPLIKDATNGSPYTSPSYFAALYDDRQGFNFANFRLLAIDNSANVPNTYFLESRVTGQSGSHFVTGTTPLNYGQQYNLVVNAHSTNSANDASILYVNPTHSDLSLETPYLTAPILTGTPNASIGSFVISQFASATTGNEGFSLASVRVADTAEEASHFVSGDVNFDGIVNGQDISAIASHWLASGTYLTGDANGDNIVNGQDIAAAASHWLSTYSPPPGGGTGTAVPEPSSIVLVAVGLLACLAMVRKKHALA